MKKLLLLLVCILCICKIGVAQEGDTIHLQNLTIELKDPSLENLNEKVDTITKLILKQQEAITLKLVEKINQKDEGLELKFNLYLLVSFFGSIVASVLISLSNKKSPN